MDFKIEKVIDAPAAVVWDILGPQFATIDEWASFVNTSRPLERSEVPAGVVAAPDAPVPGRETMTKVKIAEVITAYSDENRTLTFRGVGLPKVVKLVQDEQSVRIDSATSCIATFHITVEFLRPGAVFGPVLKRRMSKQFSGILEDLKVHSEAVHNQHAN